MEIELTDQGRDAVLLTILFLVIILTTAFVFVSVFSIPEVPESGQISGSANLKTPFLLVSSPASPESISSDTLNESYVVDNEDIAIGIWNKLMKQGINCTLIFGNPELTNESIIQCNRLWVVAENKAIDSGQIYTDVQHFEGYHLDTPKEYKDLKDALDDYAESKARYVSDVEKYNTLLNQAAKTNMQSSKNEYMTANDRLISVIA